MFKYLRKAYVMSLASYAWIDGPGSDVWIEPSTQPWTWEAIPLKLKDTIDALKADWFDDKELKIIADSMQSEQDKISNSQDIAEKNVMQFSLDQRIAEVKTIMAEQVLVMMEKQGGNLNHVETTYGVAKNENWTSVLDKDWSVIKGIDIDTSIFNSWKAVFTPSQMALASKFWITTNEVMETVKELGMEAVVEKRQKEEQRVAWIDDWFNKTDIDKEKDLASAAKIINENAVERANNERVAERRDRKTEQVKEQVLAHSVDAYNEWAEKIAAEKLAQEIADIDSKVTELQEELEKWVAIISEAQIAKSVLQNWKKRIKSLSTQEFTDYWNATTKMLTLSWAKDMKDFQTTIWTKADGISWNNTTTKAIAYFQWENAKVLTQIDAHNAQIAELQKGSNEVDFAGEEDGLNNVA